MLAQGECTQRQHCWRRAILQSALAGFPVTLATNHEYMQMIVGPAHDHLDDFVELPKRHGLGNEHTSPSRRTQSAERDSEL